MSTATAEVFEISVADAGPACKKLTVTVSAAEVASRLEAGYADAQASAMLPGFRRGRVPRRIVEQKFGGQVRFDTRNNLISEGYSEALKKHGLDPLTQPELVEGGGELKGAEAYSFTVQVEISPEVALPAFDSLSLTKPKAEVTDAQIEAEVKTQAERLGKPTQPEGAVQIGDYVEVAVKVLEGKDAKDGAPVLHELPMAYTLANGADKEFKGHVAGIVIENLGKALEGQQKGAAVRVNAAGPKQHEIEALREKDLTLVLTITGLHRIVPATEAEIEQRFSIEAGQLRAKLREELQSQAEANQQAALRTQVADKLAEAVNFDLPAKVTQNQAARILMRTRYELLYKGTPAEEVEAKLAEMRNASDEAAKKQLKLFFILDKASKDLGVDVSDAEINTQIAMMAFRQGRRPEKLREELQKQMGIEQIYLQIREQKALDAVVAKAKVVEA